jgi:hypothetical protein
MSSGLDRKLKFEEIRAKQGSQVGNVACPPRDAKNQTSTIDVLLYGCPVVDVNLDNLVRPVVRDLSCTPDMTVAAFYV